MNAKPGDIILCHSSGILGKLIRIGERIRDPRKSAKWNHAAVVLDNNGSIMEALKHGISLGNISAYPDHEVISNNFTQPQVEDLLRYAKAMQGVPYGYLTIISIALDLLLPFIAHFRSGKTLICSEFAAKTWEHAGWICPKIDTSHVMPSDLDKWLNKGNK